MSIQLDDYVYHDPGAVSSNSQAIAVLRVNTENFPESANVWDSLADAFFHSGDVSNAVQSYQKALKLTLHTRRQTSPRGSLPSALRNKSDFSHAGEVDSVFTTAHTGRDYFPSSEAFLRDAPARLVRQELVAVGSGVLYLAFSST